MHAPGGRPAGHPRRTYLVILRWARSGASRLGVPARRSVSWPAAHRIPAARRGLICTLCAGRVRWPGRSLARRAFAPGVAGHTAQLPQAGRGERPGDGERFLVRHSPGKRRPARGLACRRDEQEFSCLPGRSVRGPRDVREVYRPGAAGCGPG